MTLYPLGRTLDGEPAYAPADEAATARSVLDVMRGAAASIRMELDTVERGIVFRGEVSRRVADVGDPHAVGWALVVARNDPHCADIVRALAPLVRHRSASIEDAVLAIDGGDEHTWADWLQDEYFARELSGKGVPQYLLLAGEPAYLPFRLQSLLASVASVGRVAFDTTAAYETYARKVVRLESASEPVVGREVVLFGPDTGVWTDATWYSRHHMIEPLAEHVGGMGFATTLLAGDEASKDALVEALRGSQPALVYTASHGVCAPAADPARQARYNGAICCVDYRPRALDALFSADDVPADEPFLEGAAFFQFACFGYGTPAESDFAHWLDGMPKRCADADFVAALPRALLAHPRGPIAYVGHLDTAFLLGFASEPDKLIAGRWHERLQPFVHAVNELLGVQPAGLAMEDMRRRLRLGNQLLASYFDRERRGRLAWDALTQRKLIDHWLSRTDALNYMVFGDPAARLRIPSGG
jgi:hypothetical protein